MYPGDKKEILKIISNNKCYVLNFKNNPFPLKNFPFSLFFDKKFLTTTTQNYSNYYFSNL